MIYNICNIGDKLITVGLIGFINIENKDIMDIHKSLVKTSNKFHANPGRSQEIIFIAVVLWTAEISIVVPELYKKIIILLVFYFINRKSIT